MKDPLNKKSTISKKKNNTKSTQKSTSNHRLWLWLVIGFLFIIVLLWLVFTRSTEPSLTIDELRELEIQHQQQSSAYEQFNENRPTLTPEQREERINTLFVN